MLNLSQAQLADGLGVSFQQVQKYEKGTNRISASRLQQTAKHLNVTVPFFFEGLPHHSGAAKGRVEFPSADLCLRLSC
jgi:transcriptional regulator with XRE-family HTH domain